MVQTTAFELQRQFDEFQRQARREPVEITHNGRHELAPVSD